MKVKNQDQEWMLLIHQLPPRPTNLRVRIWRKLQKLGAAVIWPRGLAGGTDWFAAVMSIAAFFALYRLKADVLWIVIAGGLIGLGRALLIR